MSSNSKLDSDSRSSSGDRDLLSGPDMLSKLMADGITAKDIFKALAPGIPVPPSIDTRDLWRLLHALAEPPKRKKLHQYNTINDAVELISKSKNIVVLSGAGISTAAGIPDFRSRNGLYKQINAEYPDLPSPSSMFDIEFFRSNPLPFFHFARTLFPGQFKPTLSHQFVKCIEDHGKLLRNYTQNIDTLEKQAGIKRVIECHGSFDKASCTSCKFSVDGESIRGDVMTKKVPLCPRCHGTHDGPQDGLGIMKPNIIFFGEQLSSEFHKALEEDKPKVDLLIVIGSSLKVRPVALIPRAIPETVPQILINREPLRDSAFDIELLGNSDEIIQEVCSRLEGEWAKICSLNYKRMTELVGPPKKLISALKNNRVIDQHNSSDTSESSTSQNKMIHPSSTSNTDSSRRHSTPELETNIPKFNDENAVDVHQPSSSQSDRPIVAIVDSDEDTDEESDEESEDDYHDLESILPNYQKAEINIPEASFVYLQPSTYLFKSAELTQIQLDKYLRDVNTSGTS